MDFDILEAGGPEVTNTILKDIISTHCIDGKKISPKFPNQDLDFVCFYANVTLINFFENFAKNKRTCAIIRVIRVGIDVSWTSFLTARSCKKFERFKV